MYTKLVRIKEDCGAEKTYFRTMECWKYLENQTVNDGVAHSKNPKKCAYHMTFDLDLDLEHTLDAC